MDQIITVPVARLHPSPTNPRKHGLLKGIDELADSVRSVGVLQPIVARASGKDFEVVFGHRRREAAIRAELDEVPVIVRTYDDDQVLEAQTVENLQREDVHPLDEADGFAVLLKRGYDLARIAAKLGKPTSYVAQRLKLCSLSKDARKALDEELISLGVALELAKLPNEKLQAEALKVVAPARDARFAEDRVLLRVVDARAEIEREVMRKLSNAPFDTADAKLLPKAGPCTTCPKRTGVQVDLFPEASSPDLCTDPVCFREKSDAKWKLLQKTAKAEGKKLLGAKETSETFDQYGGRNGGLRWNSNFEALNGTTRNGAGRDVSVRGLFKPDEMPDVFVAKNPHTGDVVELVPKKAVERALAKRSRQAAHKERTSKTPAQKAADAKEKAATERARAKEAVRAAVSARCVAAIADAVQKAGTKAELFVLDLVLEQVADMFYEGLERSLARRGLADTKKKRRSWVDDVAAIRREPKYADASWVRGILAELCLSEYIEQDGFGARKGLIEKACKTMGVDRAAIEKTVVAEQKAAKTATPAEASKPKSKKPSKKKGGRK